MDVLDEVQAKKKLIAYIKSKTEEAEIAAKEKKSRVIPPPTAYKPSMASVGKGIMGIEE